MGDGRSWGCGEAAFEGGFEEGAFFGEDGFEGDDDSGGFFGVAVEGEEGEGWIEFGVIDFGPSDEVEEFFGFEEGEDFDPEGGEDEVGVTDAAAGETCEEGGDGEGDEGEPPREAGVSEKPGEEKDEGEREGDGGGDDEGLALGGAGEAKFLVGFGDFFGDGHGSELIVGHRKGVALGEVAGFEAFHEPAESLCGGAVAEGFGAFALARLALEGIVADRLSGVHRFFDVAFFEEAGVFAAAEVLIGVVGPEAGVEIGLEF